MEGQVFSFRDTSPRPAVEGPLGGTRVIVQPGLSVRGWPTDGGSKALERFVALEDATIVTLLRNAGAAISGSARMAELGFGLTGDRLAAAVGMNEADLGIMTDTMGEARVAAAQEGLIAFKPSFGTVSRLGLIGIEPSLEVPSVVGRDLARMQQALAAMCVRDDNDFSMTGEDLPDFLALPSLQGEAMRIGVVKEYLEGLDELERSAMDAALAALESTGFAVQGVSFPDYGLFGAVHNIVGAVEASSSAGKYDGVRYGHRTATAKNWNEMYLKSRGESFGTLIKAYLFQGAFFQFNRYDVFEQACRVRRALVERSAQLMVDVGCMAFLTTCRSGNPYAAATVSDVYGAFAASLPANVTGGPSVQLPGMAVAEGRDLGLQLVGGRLSDPSVLARAMHIIRQREGVAAS